MSPQPAQSFDYISKLSIGLTTTLIYLSSLENRLPKMLKSFSNPFAGAICQATAVQHAMLANPYSSHHTTFREVPHRVYEQ